jgi:hypothetical protein
VTTSPTQATAALQLVDANLLWLHQPHRPTCEHCDGTGRIGEGHQRRPCQRCDGIGTLRPRSRTSTIHLAGQLLLDGELQAAIVKAQRPEGATKPTEGSTAWSDPTGNAAATEAAVELRAAEITRGWSAGLAITAECIAAIDAIVRSHHALGPNPRPLTTKATIERIRWMLIAPQRHLERAMGHLTDEELAELGHATDTAVEASSAVRHGRPAYTGRTAPSVNGVIEAARRATRAAPPKPKATTKPQGCVSCARDGGYFEAICTDRYDAKNLCRSCGDYASAERSWPPLGAVQYRHRTGKALTWKVIEEAKRNERRAKGA